MHMDLLSKSCYNWRTTITPVATLPRPPAHRKGSPMPPLDDSTIARFWSKVDQSGGPDACWLWTGAKRDFGYGRVKINRRFRRAHRVAWLASFGAIPAGLCVCHACDNPPCCNPAHLFLGTQAENLADMVAKGRHNPSTGDRHGSPARPGCRMRGEANGRAKLTDAKVACIRARYAAGGVSQCSLAREYGVSHPAINNIVQRKSWVHISAPTPNGGWRDDAE